VSSKDPRIPDLTSNLDVRMGHVRKGYSDYSQTIVFLAVAVSILAVMATGFSYSGWSEWISVASAFLDSLGFSVSFLSALALSFAVMAFVLARPVTVYLVDFATYKAPKRMIADAETFISRSVKVGCFTPEALELQKKLVEKSCIGPTAFPDGIVSDPPVTNMASARQEAEEVMFTCVQELLDRNKLKPRDIDILIVNCSLFCPTPSLSAMIVNRFKMRSNIITYNLGGMGCSAGVISIDLAKRVMQSYPNCRAIVVSTENITMNWYQGNDKSMLVPNTLFRVGCAAVLLSNRKIDRFRSMFKLLHCVRTHKGSDDECFKCVYQREDEAGKVGLELRNMS